MDLAQARKKRGWSFHQAAAHMRGVTEQQLRNLEGVGATRATDPLHVRLGTALEILRVYHPDVSLDTFVGERTLFRLVPKDEGAKRRLPRYAAKNYAEGVA